MKNRIIKSTLSLLLVLSLFLGLLPAVSPVAEAAYTDPGWLPDGVYEISAKVDSNYVWDLDLSTGNSGNYYDGARLKVAPRDGSNTQKWVLRNHGNGVYTIRNLECNNWLNVHYNESSKSILHLYRGTTSSAEKIKDSMTHSTFSLEYHGDDGTYSIKNLGQESNKYATLTDLTENSEYVTAAGTDSSKPVTRFYIKPVHYSYNSFTNGGTFYIKYFSKFNINNGTPYALDMGDPKTDAGIGTRVWTHVADPLQKYIVEPTSDGHYAIRANCSGRLLTVGTTKGPDAASKITEFSEDCAYPITQQSKGAATDISEKWNIVPNEDGSFTFISCRTGGAMDAWINVPDDSAKKKVHGDVAEHVRIGTWHAYYNAGQKYTFANANNTGLDALIDGDTGVYADTFDPSDTISFPIVIYDYLNDGMLFEYAESGEYSDSSYNGANYRMGANVAFGMLRTYNGSGNNDANGVATSSNPNVYWSTKSANYDSFFCNNKSFVGSEYTASLQSSHTTGAKAAITNALSMSAKASSDALNYSNAEVASVLGYTLFNKLTSGLATVGLVQPSLGADGYPQYTDDAITYIANTLAATLSIPQSSDGKYNYNYVAGSVPEDKRYGDGKDLAQALRDCIVSDPAQQSTKSSYKLGSKVDSGDRLNHLRGVSWKDAAPYIKTCYDAAYYLLNSLFASASYHEAVKPDTEFTTLKLTKVTTTAGKTGYIFDAGFSDSTSVKMADSSVPNSAVSYDNATKTISNTSAIGKTMFYYSWSNTYGTGSATTYYPFLPLRDSSGTQTRTATPYFKDDGVVSTTTDRGTYVNRNYNYVLKSTGRFVYEPDNDLFFDFEGDDDVYLFINNQLVLDIGGAHSITKVEMNLNDYVNWAWSMKNNSAAYASLSATDKARVDALALEAGESYDFDFFYMERHGYGANMRIFTNISLSNKDATTVKHAYQDGELQNNATINPNALVEYGFSIENTGNENLTNFTFTDNDLGVTISYDKGLVVAEDMKLTGDKTKDDAKASLVDKDGNALDPSDIVIEYYDAHNNKTTVYTTDTNNGLMDYLTYSGTDDTNNIVLQPVVNDEASSHVHTGDKITIRGIYVKNIDRIQQMKDGSKFTNTVQTVCYPVIDGNPDTSQPLSSNANFTV